MGNSAATLSITLDHENTQGGANLASRAGEPVQGKITLQVEKTLKNVCSVRLYIIGKEKGRIKSRDQPASQGERNLVRSMMVVHRAHQQRLEPGVYHFRFSFVLPAVLPTSMSWVNGPNWCNIKYKLKASVVAVPFSKPIVETKRPLLVAARPLPSSQVPCFLNPTSHAIKSLGGLLNKGTISLGVSVKDTHVGRGKDLEVCFASRNNSTVSIKEVEVQLIETVRIKCGNTQRTTRTKLKEMHIPEFGVKKKSRSEVRGIGRGTVNPHDENYQEIYNDLQSERYKINFPVPYNIRDTYDGGHIISVSHHLHITYHTKSMNDNPNINIPLKIGYPPLETIEVTAEPVLPQPVPAPVQETDEVIPIAQAVSVPSDANHPQAAWSPVVEIPAENIIVGGVATVEEDDNVSTEWSGLVPVPPPRTPTVETLLEEMLSSVNDFDIISNKMEDPSWSQVFGSLTPDEFGSIIAHVNVDFEQPKIASFLAPRINGGRNFTHDYVIAGLKNTANWNRTTMLHELLPYCSDFDLGRSTIMAELSSWEQTVSSRDLAAALKRTVS